MTEFMIQDLLKHKPHELYMILEEWRINAGWGGYFFEGPIVDALRKKRSYNFTNKHGMYLPIWHRFDRQTSIPEMIQLITSSETFDATISGYVNTGKIEAFKTNKPDLYMCKTEPHIALSWKKNVNERSAGNEIFSPLKDGKTLTLKGGQLKFVLINNKPMDLYNFRYVLQVLETQRANELRTEIDTYAQQTAAGLASKYNLQSVDWNAVCTTLADKCHPVDIDKFKLYTHYISDLLESKMI